MVVRAVTDPTPPPVDWSQIVDANGQAIPAEIPDEPPPPDHRASRTPRAPRALFGKPAGDKRDDKPRAATRRKTVPNREGQFIEPLTNLYGGIGLTLSPFDPICGQAFMVNAEPCARALDALAYRNESVRRLLWSITQTSAVGMVFAAHLPILAAIAMHHVPAVQEMLGTMGAEFAENIARQAAEGNSDAA
jgi:hypothetical protein